MGSNCHTLCASDLAITWGDNSCYWRWCCDGGSNVAELIQVWWLEVKGSFDTRRLSCGNSLCECEVSFLVKLRNCASGWHLPVTVAVCLPNGTRKEICVNLSNRPREQWFEISAGRFSTCPGEINFSLCQVNTNCAKSGLVIKGVKICCQRRECCERNRHCERKHCCQRKTCCQRTSCCGREQCCCERNRGCQRKNCCERRTCHERTRCCGRAKCCCERRNCCQRR